MALTETQLNMVMSQSVDQIKKYISQGLVKFPQDLLKYKDTPRFKAIENELQNIPSPEAIARWKEIEAMASSGDTSKMASILNEFITRYGNYPGNADMVEKARKNRLHG